MKHFKHDKNLYFFLNSVVVYVSRKAMQSLYCLLIIIEVKLYSLFVLHQRFVSDIYMYKNLKEH